MSGRYKNLDPTSDRRNLRDVVRWKLGLGPTPRRSTPDRAPVPFVENDGLALRGALRPSLTWVGHATYLLQLGGLSILTDPVLSERVVVVKRNVPPGLTYQTLPKIDVVTVSHNHMDHLDAPTLRKLGAAVKYVVPRGLGAWFASEGLPDVVELDWWQQCSVGTVTITLVPAQHWSRRGLTDTDETLWGGFVYEGEGKRVYHSGDTAYFSGFKLIGDKCGTIDAAMLPIGAYDPRWFMKPQHMNPDDAVQAFEDLGARRFFAMHWGTFKLTDEPLDEPPVLTRERWRQRGLDPARLVIPAVGETVAL